MIFDEYLYKALQNRALMGAENCDRGHNRLTWQDDPAILKGLAETIPITQEKDNGYNRFA